MNFLKLIRFPNIILITFMQIILYFGFLKNQNINVVFDDVNFIILLFATLFITAAGYIINDIFDQDTDLINKPDKVIVGKSITEAKAYNYYSIINIIGVALGFILANRIDKPGFATIFIFVAALLYFYATTLKGILIVGNLSIALISGISVMIVPVFILFPLINEENSSNIQLIFSIIKDFAIFVFINQLVSEIVKDCEDYIGDNQSGIFTFPVKFGLQKTKILILFIAFFLILVIIIYLNNYLIVNKLYYAIWFILLFILGPLLFLIIEIFKAKEPKDYKKCNKKY
jgi:4-hydroxybenzoate polyprenyltransferase